VPRREDIHSVLVIGSGPIVIGQACEFDYSGTQACRVLRDEGMISPEHLRLFDFADSAEQAWDVLLRRGLHVPGND